MVTGGEPRAPRPGWDHTQPVLLGGRGRAAYSRAGLGRKTTKLGWSWKNLPRDPPRQQAAVPGRGQRPARCRPRANTCGQSALPAASNRQGRPPRGPVWPSLSQLLTGEAEGTGRGPEHPSVLVLPLAPAGGGTKAHMVLGQPGRGGARLLRNPRGRRWGSVLGRNRPDSAHLAPASPLPGPRG